MHVYSHGHLSALCAQYPDKMEGNDKNEKKTQECREFLMAMTLGAALSCVVLSIIIFFTKGVSNIDLLATISTTCTTALVDQTTVAECSYDCGNYADSQCMLTYDCWHVYAIVEDKPKSTVPSQLFWNFDSRETNCSNYRRCNGRGVSIKYEEIGDEYSCYYDSSRPNAVYLHPPRSPLPYLIGSCLTAIAAADVIRDCLVGTVLSLLNTKRRPSRV